MKPHEVLDFYKTKYNFHKVTGMAAASLGNWIKWGFIPENSQYKLERITKGKLKTEWTEDE